MTENEAVKHAREYIKYLNHSGWEKDFDAIEKLIVATEEIQQYRAIGTIEEFKDLKEKSVAKKVVSRGQGHEADCYCPNCNAFLGNDQDFCFSHTNYCEKCGQALET